MKRTLARLLTCLLVLALTLPVLAAAAAEPKELPAPPAGFADKREGIERGKVETVEYESKSIGDRMQTCRPTYRKAQSRVRIDLALRRCGPVQTPLRVC